MNAMMKKVLERQAMQKLTRIAPMAVMMYEANTDIKRMTYDDYMRILSRTDEQLKADFDRATNRAGDKIENGGMIEKEIKPL
jgi:ribosomal protein L22